MNESLRRALLQAGLSEDDVAARLEVDPKTVRRWLEGRVPFLRHRWALAGMLGVDETELWPQLRGAGSVPAEVVAIYPHLGAVPREMWLRLFGSAEQRIDILAESEDRMIGDPGVQQVLTGKGQAGVAIRICLVDPTLTDGVGDRETGRVQVSANATLAALTDALSEGGRCVEVRCRSGPLYAAVYRADDELLVSQRAHGISPAEAAVLHLRGDADGSLAAAYAESFERLWVGQELGQ